MKKVILKALIFTAFLVVLFPSCDKEESNQTTTENSLSVKIDGQLFETNSIIIGLVGSEQQLFTFTQFSITAGNILEEYMIILFALPFDQTIESMVYDYTDDNCDDPTEQICASITYSIGVENGKAGVSNVNDGSSYFTITSIDFNKGGYAKGTFSGILINGNNGESIDVTDGKFEVNIPD